MENVERKWTFQNKGVKNSRRVPAVHPSVHCGERFGPTCVMVNGVPGLPPLMFPSTLHNDLWLFLSSFPWRQTFSLFKKIKDPP